MDGSERNQLEQVLLERRSVTLPARVIVNRTDFLLCRKIPESGIPCRYLIQSRSFCTRACLRLVYSLTFSHAGAVNSKYRKIFSLLWVINCLKTTTSYDRAVDYVHM